MIRPAHGISRLINFQKNSDLSSGARILNLNLSIRLSLFCVCVPASKTKDTKIYALTQKCLNVPMCGHTCTYKLHKRGH